MWTILTGDNVSLCIAKSWAIQGFMDRFFSFLSRNKSVFSFKNRSRTGKTDDFSSPGTNIIRKKIRPAYAELQSDPCHFYGPPLAAAYIYFCSPTFHWYKKSVEYYLFVKSNPYCTTIHRYPIFSTRYSVMQGLHWLLWYKWDRASFVRLYGR